MNKIVFCFVLLFLMTMTIILSMTEKFNGIDLLFEVASALATVGVSKGITAELTIFGKLMISFTMLVGRIGIVSFAISLVKSIHNYEHRVDYPNEGVSVG